MASWRFDPEGRLHQEYLFRLLFAPVWTFLCFSRSPLHSRVPTCSPVLDTTTDEFYTCHTCVVGGFDFDPHQALNNCDSVVDLETKFERKISVLFRDVLFRRRYQGTHCLEWHCLINAYYCSRGLSGIWSRGSMDLLVSLPDSFLISLGRVSDIHPSSIM